MWHFYHETLRSVGYAKLLLLVVLIDHGLLAVVSDHDMIELSSVVGSEVGDVSVGM